MRYIQNLMMFVGKALIKKHRLYFVGDNKEQSWQTLTNIIPEEFIAKADSIKFEIKLRNGSVIMLSDKAKKPRAKRTAKKKVGVNDFLA